MRLLVPKGQTEAIDQPGEKRYSQTCKLRAAGVWICFSLQERGVHILLDRFVPTRPIALAYSLYGLVNEF